MNNSKLKCFIYILVAALTCLATELNTVKDISELSSLKLINIGVAMAIQSFVALKAFMDQSLSDKKEESSENTSSI